ncbi:MAG: DUF4159 domain-containing protein [Gemmatimonadaceae bacterium]
MRTAGAVTLLLASANDAGAQRRYGGYGRNSDPSGFSMPFGWTGNTPYDGRFTFARIKYRGNGMGAGWRHDFPRAETHFMHIIRAITTIRPFVESGPIVGGNILALDDPELFKYPVAYLSEPGGWFPTSSETEGLRNYLLKGGFLIVDDFDGPSMHYDWAHFVDEMRKVFPAARLAQIPQTHPIFDSFFKIDFDKLVAYRTGESPSYFAIYQDNDPKKRVMVIVNFNQDIGDYWEWSDRGFNLVPSNEAYKLGVNYLIYALTH